MKSIVLTGALASIALPACQTPSATPLVATYMQPLIAEKNPGGFVEISSISQERSFVLPEDWRFGSWVIERGGRLTFREDGLGEFVGRISSQDDRGVEELHLIALPFGNDENVLFRAPGADTGFQLNTRRPFHERTFSERFGFDEKQFTEIQDVKLFARLRIPPEASYTYYNPGGNDVLGIEVPLRASKAQPK